MANSTGEVIGGIDTHKHKHHAAVINEVGQLLGTRQFDADAAGYAALLDWLRSHGTVRSIGIEGTGHKRDEPMASPIGSTPSKQLEPS